MFAITVNNTKYEIEVEFLPHRDMTVYFVHIDEIDGLWTPYIGYIYGDVREERDCVEFFAKRTILQNDLIRMTEDSARNMVKVFEGVKRLNECNEQIETLKNQIETLKIT